MIIKEFISIAYAVREKIVIQVMFNCSHNFRNHTLLLPPTIMFSPQTTLLLCYCSHSAAVFAFENTIGAEDNR